MWNLLFDYLYLILLQDNDQQIVMVGVKDVRKKFGLVLVQG